MAEIDPDTMATPWRRDPSETAPALQRWAEHRIGSGVVVSDVGEPGNGMSSETALFTVTHPDGRAERLVARLAPSPDVYPVFQKYDLAMQRGCMDLVRERTTAPAPVCRWLENDPSWLSAGIPETRDPRGVARADPETACSPARHSFLWHLPPSSA